MAVLSKVIEVSGNPEAIEAAITTALGALTVAAGTVPNVALSGSPQRMLVVIVYRNS